MSAAASINWTRRWAFLALSILMLHFAASVSHGLLEPDEGRYANMALEWTELSMHDWAEPMMSDVGHFDKPPVIYWLTGISFRWFGENEIAARLPSLFGSILALTGVAILSWKAYGQTAAWWSVLVCGSTIQFWALGQLLSPDMLLCGFCTLGAALTVTADKTRRGRILWLLGAVCWSLAWWTKATAALVPLGAITFALFFSGRKDLLSAFKPLRLLLIILALGCPWYLMMMQRHPELTDFFFHRELVGRIVGHEDGRKGFPGYHIAVAIGMWLPWWPVLLESARKQFPRWRTLPWRNRREAVPWEAMAAIGVLLIFSFVSSKLVTYTLTGVPFLAAAVGSLIHSQPLRWKAWPTRIALVMSVAFLITAPSIYFLEDRLGSNSSVRRAAKHAKEVGVELLIFDRHRPGAEFYFGENVIYVNTKDIVQVDEAKGQNPHEHFTTAAEMLDRINATTGGVWYVQTLVEQPGWGRDLVQKYSAGERMTWSGDFRVWRIKE